eukprot:UN26644
MKSKTPLQKCLKEEERTTICRVVQYFDHIMTEHVLARKLDKPEIELLEMLCMVLELNLVLFSDRLFYTHISFEC